MLAFFIDFQNMKYQEKYSWLTAEMGFEFYLKRNSFSDFRNKFEEQGTWNKVIYYSIGSELYYTINQ
jgi:hypothetical protein